MKIESFKTQFLNDTIGLFTGKCVGMSAHLYEHHIGMNGNQSMSGDLCWNNAATLEPNYYLPSSDIKLLNEHISDVATLLPSGLPVVDFGPGSISAISTKSMKILEAIGSKNYQPIDTSHQFTQEAEDHISQHLPTIKTEGKVADFFSPLTAHDYNEEALAYFGGSTLSNLTCCSTDKFPRDIVVNTLRNFSYLINEGWLLISFDSNNNADWVYKMYDTRWFERFILNVFYRMQVELPHENFDPSIFIKTSVWHEKAHKMTHYATASKDLSFKLNGTPIDIKAGQQFNIYNCYKFPPDLFESCAIEAGFEVIKRWDHETPMKLYLLKCRNTAAQTGTTAQEVAA